MDSGEVIPGLNEDWTLGGAKMMEWISGFMMFIICSELLVDNVGRAMPLLVTIWVVTTFGLAGLRRSFPDEERGVRNFFALALGFVPPGIPAPATLQPIWSGSPMRGLDEECEFMQLELIEALFPGEEEADDDF